MNEPHVVALIYRVEHRPTVSYDKAAPLEHEGPTFCIRVESGRARFRAPWSLTGPTKPLRRRRIVV